MDRAKWSKRALAAYFVLFTAVLYLPMILMAILSFQDAKGLPYFPMQGFSGHWWQALFDDVDPRLAGDRDPLGGDSRRSYLALVVGAVTAFLALTLSMAFRRRFRGDGVLFYLIMLGLMTPGLPAQPRHAARSGSSSRATAGSTWSTVARHERRLGPSVRLPRHGRGLEPLRPARRGGLARPRRLERPDVPRGDAAARLDGPLRRLPVRLRRSRGTSTTGRRRSSAPVS